MVLVQKCNETGQWHPIWMVIIGVLFLGCSKSDDGNGGGSQDPDPETRSPTITAIDPTSGTAGTELTISGTNFSTTVSGNTVTINGTSATVTSASSGQLVVTVPEGASTGLVAVSVAGETAQGPTFTIIEGDVSLCDSPEITEDTIWEDVVPGDGIDYIIDCSISVKGNALLTIQPGVVIAFEGENSGIFTSEGGGLKAIGSAESPIIFKGTSANKGVWQGIYFGSNHPENRLESVQVMHAGRTASGQSGEKGAVQLSRDEDSGASLVDCSITDNEGYGIFVTEDSDLEEFSNNTISNNEGPAVGIYFNQSGALDPDSDYSGNDGNYVEVRESPLEDGAVTMAALNIPFRFVDGVKYNINNALTIEAGSILEFASGAGLRMGVQATDCGSVTGSLLAEGTANAPIIFRGIVAGSGTWLGIGINSSSPNNRLVYCDISGAGSAKMYNAASFGANITLQCDSRLVVQHSTITESAAYGIYLHDEDAELEDFLENTLSDNEEAPVWMHLPQVDQLDAASDYGQGNGRPYIQVLGDAVTDADLTIKNIDVPYRIQTDRAGRVTYVERGITIEPGTILEFDTGAGLVLGSPGVDCIPVTGSLTAEGTADLPIVFRGTSDGQGSWLGLGFNSSTNANRMTYCEISGGGSNQMYNAGGQGNIVLHCTSSLFLENCSVTDSGGWGVDFVQGGNILTENANVFDNNQSGDIATN